MPKKQSLEEYIKQLELEYQAARQEEEIKTIRINRLLKMFIVVIATYSLVALIALVVIDKEKNFNFLPSNNNSETISKEEVDSLNKRITELEKALKEAKESNKDLGLTNFRLSLLEDRQKAISDTLLEDPDKALTAKLIREQQEALEKNVEEQKNNVSRIDQKVDNFVSNILTAPIIGFFLTLFAGAATILWNWSRNKKT